MKIADIYKGKSLTTSFEVFPPNDKVGLDQVYNCLDVLSLEKPDYISVTYGAGGNTKGRTVEIADRIKNQNGVESVAHLTCIGAKKEEIDTLMQLFEKHNGDVAKQVGVSVGKATLQKYNVCKRHFSEFLEKQYKRSDLKLTELTYVVIREFDLYLRTEVGQNPNTATKTMKTFKTITLLGQKMGVLLHDPFMNHRFHIEPVNRGFLTDEEILLIAHKQINIPRLELIRDIFIFSCFTGLAYIDVSNLTPDHIVTLGDKQWIMTQRQKTSVETNVLLLDIPKAIIAKYGGKTYRNGKLFPMLTNQKTNSYLKEIADICGIKKNLTFHLARHTFATMSLSKGVPMESVSKMLGHTNIRTTQIYARITNKKIEHDMEELADKLDKFNDAMGL